MPIKKEFVPGENCSVCEKQFDSKQSLESQKLIQELNEKIKVLEEECRKEAKRIRNESTASIIQSYCTLHS